MAENILQSDRLLLIPPLTSTGTYCPSDVLIFTCIGVAIPLVLDWRINNDIIATYVFEEEDVFPHDFTVGNITISIQHGTQLSQDNIYHNISSTLTAVAADLSNTSIRCDSQLYRSEPYHIRIRMPPIPQIHYCSLEIIQQQMKVSFQFSNYSSNGNVINRYSTSLITSQGFIQNKVGLPWDYYDWTNLAEGSSFTLNVMAYNCRNQSSPSYNYYIQTARKLSSIFRIKASQWEPFNTQIISLQWKMNDLHNGFLSNRIYDNNDSLSDIIEVIAKETRTGHTVMNKRFSQNTDFWCEPNELCSIQFLANSRKELNVTINVHFSGNINQCNISESFYTEFIPSVSMRPFDISIITNDSTLSLYCTSSLIDQFNCSVQFTVGHQLTNFSDAHNILNHLPLVLPVSYDTLYSFEVTVQVNPTLTMVVGKTHKHEQNCQQEIFEVNIPPTNREKIVLETHYFILLVTIMIIILMLLIITIVGNLFLLYKVKSHKKSDNQMELRQVVASQAPPPCSGNEAIYEELSGRSMYMEINNETYNKYQHHYANKTQAKDTTQNQEYDYPV